MTMLFTRRKAPMAIISNPLRSTRKSAQIDGRLRDQPPYGGKRGNALLKSRATVIRPHIARPKRLVVHHFVAEVEGWFGAQERHVEPTADERLGEVRRIVAQYRDLDVLQLVAQHLHGRGSQLISRPVWKPMANVVRLGCPTLRAASTAAST
jgi:hypothetical protein